MLKAYVLSASLGQGPIPGDLEAVTGRNGDPARPVVPPGTNTAWYW